MGVRVDAGAPAAAAGGAAAGRGPGAAAGADAGGKATDTALAVALGSGAAKPPLCRGAAGELGAGALEFEPPTGRGATIGRADADAPCDGPPGIIGRGGKSTGRFAPALGAGPFGVGGNPEGLMAGCAACTTGA